MTMFPRTAGVFPRNKRDLEEIERDRREIAERVPPEPEHFEFAIDAGEYGHYLLGLDDEGEPEYGRLTGIEHTERIADEMWTRRGL